MPISLLRHSTVAVSALSLLTLVACGKPKIDHSKVEEAIKSGLKEQIKGANVKTMTCPGDIESKPGTTFSCDGADADGTLLNIFVVVKDEEGNINWKLANASGGPGGAALPAPAASN